MDSVCSMQAVLHVCPMLHWHLAAKHCLSPADVCQCQVEFDYTANREDELTILPGDIINVISKQDEHWWEGELNGHVGIFPASYVQEM